MYKILISIFIVSSICLAASNKEDTYVFEAKGEFAKEMKSLIEKYSKEGKIEAKIYKKEYTKKDESKTKTEAIIATLSDNTREELKSADVVAGEKLYKNRCTTCHGVNAEKKVHNNSRVLTTLTPLKIVESLENYATDYKYGNSTKFLMQQQVSTLSANNMQSVAVYIYSLTHNSKSPITNGSSTEAESNNEPSDSYLQ